MGRSVSGGGLGVGFERRSRPKVNDKRVAFLREILYEDMVAFCLTAHFVCNFVYVQPSIALNFHSGRFNTPTSSILRSRKSVFCGEIGVRIIIPRRSDYAVCFCEIIYSFELLTIKAHLLVLRQTKFRHRTAAILALVNRRHRTYRRCGAGLNFISGTRVDEHRTQTGH